MKNLPQISKRGFGPSFEGIFHDRYKLGTLIPEYSVFLCYHNGLFSFCKSAIRLFSFSSTRKIYFYYDKAETVSTYLSIGITFESQRLYSGSSVALSLYQYIMRVRRFKTVLCGLIFVSVCFILNQKLKTQFCICGL